VFEGDCNENIGAALRDLRSWNWALTFAFIDPNGPCGGGATIETLAAFKKPRLSKVELWILFPAGLFSRNLPVRGDVRDRDAAFLSGMFGTDEWEEIYRGRLNGLLSPTEAREEYVNLMRWRLESALGYQFTAQLEVVNEQGVPLYHMIFATDNDAGTRIMSDLYRRAAAEFPQMRRQARERRRRLHEEQDGILRLPGLEEDLEAAAMQGEKFYEHAPPTEPWRYPKG
jgi:three-Cys-motif partner protein